MTAEETIRETLLEFFGDSKARGRGGEGIYGRREAALAALDRLVKETRRGAEAAGERMQTSDYGMMVVQTKRADAAEAREAELREALEYVSVRLGDLTRPPFTEYHHAVAVVRDEVREKLAALAVKEQTP